MDKIAGTIKNNMYFNEEYISCLLKSIDKQEIIVIAEQTDNLIDILSRKKEIFLSMNNSKELIEKLHSFLLDHYKFQNAHELYNIINKMI